MPARRPEPAILSLATAKSGKTVDAPGVTTTPEPFASRHAKKSILSGLPPVATTRLSHFALHVVKYPKKESNPLAWVVEPL